MDPVGLGDPFVLPCYNSARINQDSIFWIQVPRSLNSAAFLQVCSGIMGHSLFSPSLLCSTFVFQELHDPNSCSDLHYWKNSMDYIITNLLQKVGNSKTTRTVRIRSRIVLADLLCIILSHC